MSNDRAVGGLPNQETKSLTKGKNYLFAIGISSYQKFDPLPNAVKDIKDLAQLLVEEYSFEQVQLLMDQEANKDNIVDKLNDLRRKVDQDDRLLIYYSGHGYMDGERGFWIPVDAEPDKVSSYVSNADVHDTIKSIKAKHLLLISDSCFSGSLLTRDVSTKMEGAFEEWDRKPSRFVFISGGGPVSDGKPGENSPFASGIINNLKENDDDTINICRLADRVTEQVRYNYKQQAEVSPLFDSGHMGGQFVFVKKRTEKEIWALANTHNDEGSFLNYLNKYPDGLYKVEAEKKLKDIADENEWNEAKEKDAAFAYRQYLKIYPDGMHIKEAKEELEKIRLQVVRQTEVATEGVPSTNQKKQKEKIDEETKEDKKEKKDKEDEKIESPRPKPQPIIINANRPGFFKKNIFIIAFIGLIVIPGSVFWYLKTIKNSAKNAELNSEDPLVDKTSTNINSLIENSFEITGEILDSAKNKISEILLTNIRTKMSITTDSLGRFAMKETIHGDTFSIPENEIFFSKKYVADKNAKYAVIKLEEKPRKKTNKTITGNVRDLNGVVKGAFIKISRNGNTVKVNRDWGVKTNPAGNYTLANVNEGDELIIDYGNGRIATSIIGRENIYNLLNNKIIKVSPSNK